MKSQGVRGILNITPEHLAQLMAAELKPYELFRNDAHAMDALRLKAASHLKDVQHRGTAKAYFKKGICEAFVSTLKYQPLHFDSVLEALNIYVRPDDLAAFAWLEEQIKMLKLDTSLLQILTLNGLHTSLLPTLNYKGIGIDAVDLIADSNYSLNQILRQYKSWPTFEEHGLECVPMQLKHVDGIVKIRRRTYRELPEYCWFGSQESHLCQYGKRMKTATQKKHLWWVLLDKENVVGNFGGDVVTDDPIWGPCANVEVLFAPQYRGKGLMKTAYRIMLEGLVAKKIPLYTGTTAQKPVMKLGRLTGRQMFRIQLHSRPVFEKQHFQTYLP